VGFTRTHFPRRSQTYNMPARTRAQQARGLADEVAGAIGRASSSFLFAPDLPGSLQTLPPAPPTLPDLSGEPQETTDSSCVTHMFTHRCENDGIQCLSPHQCVCPAQRRCVAKGWAVAPVSPAELGVHQLAAGIQTLGGQNAVDTRGVPAAVAAPHRTVLLPPRPAHGLAGVVTT
jgi:hypothetical protein